MIPINRKAGAGTMSMMTPLARERVRDDRQLIIFPEGTRRPVGAEPRYKFGVAQVYVDCGVQCLPVALNSGLFWPRRTFLRYPGTIVIEFLDVIPPGLSRDEFLVAPGERSIDDREAGRRRPPGAGAVDGHLAPRRPGAGLTALTSWPQL